MHYIKNIKHLIKYIKRPLLRNKKIILLVTTVWALIFCFIIWFIYIRNAGRRIKEHWLPREILWWTSMPKKYDVTQMCGQYFCRFSTDRKRLEIAKVVLFYASDLDIMDLPLPRYPGQLWALLHEESPRNVPIIQHKVVLQHFNFTSTFSRYSDFPLTTQYLSDPRQLTDPKYLLTVGEKDLMQVNLEIGPVAFLQSDCDTLSGREDYIRELMKLVSIDSYGKCLHNRDLPKSLTQDYLNNLYDPKLLRFLARYKFIIAYENGVCDDYITEKFWRPLIIGAVPIYFGSPTIRDWEPNKKSVIHISDFANPSDLAKFILKVDYNNTDYNEYLNHKYNMIQPIANERLKHELLTRDYSMADKSLFGAFECFVCHRLRQLKSNETFIASTNHYNCPLTPVYPPMTSKVNNSNDWKSVLEVGRYQAQVLDKLLRRNLNFSKLEFDMLLNRELKNF